MVVSPPPHYYSWGYLGVAYITRATEGSYGASLPLPTPPTSSLYKTGLLTIHFCSAPILRAVSWLKGTLRALVNVYFIVDLTEISTSCGFEPWFLYWFCVSYCYIPAVGSC
jgi:hypothetical protein